LGSFGKLSVVSTGSTSEGFGFDTALARLLNQRNTALACLLNLRGAASR